MVAVHDVADACVLMTQHAVMPLTQSAVLAKISLVLLHGLIELYTTTYQYLATGHRSLAYSTLAH